MERDGQASALHTAAITQLIICVKIFRVCFFHSFAVVAFLLHCLRCRVHAAKFSDVLAKTGHNHFTSDLKKKRDLWAKERNKAVSFAIFVRHFGARLRLW